MGIYRLTETLLCVYVFSPAMNVEGYHTLSPRHATPASLILQTAAHAESRGQCNTHGLRLSTTFCMRVLTDAHDWLVWLTNTPNQRTWSILISWTPGHSLLWCCQDLNSISFLVCITREPAIYFFKSYWHKLAWLIYKIRHTVWTLLIQAFFPW